MEFDTKMPIYLQVINEIKLCIVKGEINLGEKLLSARELALKYNINPNTASRIYKEMEAEGICYTKRGLGTFVDENSELVNMLKDEMSEKLLESFILGMNDLKYSYDDILEYLRKNYKKYK